MPREIINRGVARVKHAPQTASEEKPTVVNGFLLGANTLEFRVLMASDNVGISYIQSLVVHVKYII